MTLRAWNDRWRTFADATALALGLNLWATLDLLPGIVVGGDMARLQVALLLLPLPLLAYGVWRWNEAILLFAFPSALLLPIASTPALATLQFYSPTRFLLVGISLVAFLFGASTLTSFYEAPAPRHVRPLHSSTQPLPRRWKRRFRMYAFLAITSLAYPLVLIYRINFDETGALALAENYPGRAATFTTLLNVIAIGIWLLVYSKYILAPIKQHRTGDKPLRRELSAMRQRARRGNPHLMSYVGGVMALVLMALWFAWQA